MTVDECYLVSMRQRLWGQEVINVVAVRDESEDAMTLARIQAFANAWKEAHRPVQDPQLAYETFRAIKVRGTGVTYSTSPPFRVSTIGYEGNFTGTLVGGLGGGVDPSPQAALVEQIRTGFSGRRYRGRWYVAGISATQTQDGQYSDATVTAQQARLDTFFALYGEGGSDTSLTFGVWSDRIAMNVSLSDTWPRVRTSRGAPAPADAYQVANSLTATSVIHTQRRRVLGVGG